MSLGTSTPPTPHAHPDRPRRDAVLRAVIAAADLRRDGALPTDVWGVAETFPRARDLVAALQLRWHTRLAGNIEQALAGQPLDLEKAVLCAWRRTAQELVGLRLVLDRCADAPGDEELATALAKSQRKDWTLLAVMSGQAGVHDRQAADVGRVLELLARATFDPSATPRTRRTQVTDRRAERRDGLLREKIARFRELVAA
jgi:hypothetical protein